LSYLSIEFHKSGTFITTPNNNNPKTMTVSTKNKKLKGTITAIKSNKLLTYKLLE